MLSYFRVFVILPVFGFFVVSAARAADKLPPSANCLPDDTMLIARIPDGAAFAEAFKQHTKLGAVLSDPQRIERFKELLQSNPSGKGKWDEILA
ncbi:MAG TPA: hypothetical protein VHV77_10775, partial [Pirellulales bacterium]|nr:hypothetical protein [Pirellulales bacterium]